MGRLMYPIFPTNRSRTINGEWLFYAYIVVCEYMALFLGFTSSVSIPVSLSNSAMKAEDVRPFCFFSLDPYMAFTAIGYLDFDK